MNKISPIVDFFNHNYKTNNPYIAYLITDYIHTRHSIRFTNPKYKELVVKNYTVFNSIWNNFHSNHKTCRILCQCTNGDIIMIGAFKFKRYLREKHYNPIIFFNKDNKNYQIIN